MNFRCTYFILVLLGISAPCLAAESITLFNGESLEQWEGNPEWWRVEDGMVTGGSLERKVPHNTFLATKASFQNFDLRLKIRLRGSEGQINSGIQVRSVRVPESHEMKGYQVDAGKGWWGKLYDESRRGLLATPGDKEAVLEAVNPDGWNRYRIRCKGSRITGWINGQKTFDYTETDEEIPLNGKIAIQAHGGGKVLVQVKDVTLEKLPPTEGAPKWPEERLELRYRDAEEEDRNGAENRKGGPDTAEVEAAARPGAQKSIEKEPLTAVEQKETFILPQGFDIELVAKESAGVGKFINVTWDTAGRLWTMTGLEYPQGAGGDEPGPTTQRLFREGGRDKVLVYDEPYGPGPHQPRTFVDGQVQPLGILPYKNGAFVQYGRDIRFYRDNDGDGVSDNYEVILTGFGIQDSHLYPHRFTLAPGGSIYFGQGLFNRSKVYRPNHQPFDDGRQEIPFHATKLARFSPDGSSFEILTSGPNNIYGFVITRQGEMFLQEANDLGYPVVPYEPGAHYKTGYNKKLKPYAPIMPEALQSTRMGGTGLSGLALAQDRNGWPEPWGMSTKTQKRFYIANPLRSRIQRVNAVWKEDHYEFKKESPFLVSKDPWFRPVATHFGPDGALYIVDWYNRIISHNEVRMDHPARDRKRGRIWRIYHDSQSREAPPDLASLEEAELLDYLGHANAKLSHLAWQEIVARKAEALGPDLREIVRDRSERVDRRLGALWALEGVTDLSTELLVALLNAENGNIRREAVRIMDRQRLASERIVSHLNNHVRDPYHRVRAAIANLLRRRDRLDAEMMAVAARIGGRPAVEGGRWQAYHREFERYLARWALEKNRERLRTMLSSHQRWELSPEARAFASLALHSEKGAVHLAHAASELKRDLVPEEVSLLAEHLARPEVRQAFLPILKTPGQRDRALEILAEIDATKVTSELRSSVSKAIESLLENNPSPSDWKRVARIAGTLDLRNLEPEIRRWMTSPGRSPSQTITGIRSLRAMRAPSPELFLELSYSEDRTVRREALIALASADSAEVVDLLADRLPGLSPVLRDLVLKRAASSKKHAPKLVTAALKGEISGIDGEVMKRLVSVLGADHAGIQKLRSQVQEVTRPVLRLNGGKGSYAESNIDLTGPFTVESWIRLDAGITNEDHLLGRHGGPDFNFHNSKFRVYVGGDVHDAIIAGTPITPNTWTHVAVTRDRQGHFRIYLNGRLDQDQSKVYKKPMRRLQVGAGNKQGGEGYYTEFRVWSDRRTGEEIRQTYLQTFRGASSLPPNLKHYYRDDNWPKLHGEASIVRLRETPGLRKPEQIRKLNRQYQRYLSLARQSGDPQKGRKLFQRRCMTCHKVGDQGNEVGPPLDGIAHSGIETLIYSVIAPDTGIEPGYRQFQIKTIDGDIVDGLRVKENEDAVVIRLVAGQERRIPREKIKTARFVDSSLMPKGLLADLSDREVRDLFGYLKSLSLSP